MMINWQRYSDSAMTDENNMNKCVDVDGDWRLYNAI